MVAPRCGFRVPGEKKGTWKKSNPLEWWKVNQTAFPRLAQLAKAFLAMQATSAPSERVFSGAALILTKKRNRLDPEIIGKLLYVKKNWELEEKEGWDMLAAVRGTEAEQEQEAAEELAAEPVQGEVIQLDDFNVEELDFDDLDDQQEVVQV